MNIKIVLNVQSLKLSNALLKAPKGKEGLTIDLEKSVTSQQLN